MLGPKDQSPYHAANRPPGSNQRPPESGWSTSAWRVVAKHREQAPDLRGWGLGLGTRRGEGAPHPGRVRPSSSWLPELLDPGKAQNTGAAESTLLWNTRGLEPRAAQGTLHREQPGA